MSGATIRADTLIDYVVGDDSTEQIRVTMLYKEADPFTVSIAFPNEEAPNKPKVWVFARELLDQGRHGTVGDGDVLLEPISNTEGHFVILKLFPGTSEEARFYIPRDTVASFLELTFVLVRPGEESEHLDVDGVIAEIESGNY